MQHVPSAFIKIFLEFMSLCAMQGLNLSKNIIKINYISVLSNNKIKYEKLLPPLRISVCR